MEQHNIPGALRAPYETYRETEVFGKEAKLSLGEMLLVHKGGSLSGTDSEMLEWISAIDDTDRWCLNDFDHPEISALDRQALFELIMTLEVMYQRYGNAMRGSADKWDFAYAVAEVLDETEGLILDDLAKDPEPVYIYLENMGL